VRIYFRALSSHSYGSALSLADEIEDEQTGFLIERPLDEAAITAI